MYSHCRLHLRLNFAKYYQPGLDESTGNRYLQWQAAQNLSHFRLYEYPKRSLLPEKKNRVIHHNIHQWEWQKRNRDKQFPHIAHNYLWQASLQLSEEGRDFAL